MAVLITGVAGFIGFHISQRLLSEGESVIGIDNLNQFSEVEIKIARLNQLLSKSNFTFLKVNIHDKDELVQNWTKLNEVNYIVHLAAQTGVRSSVEKPHLYISSNIDGHFNILELARKLKNLKHFIYASSSSVYGNSKNIPSKLDDDTGNPRSLYAATKKASELMTIAYSNLYGIPATGLRFFTVYGPWGRPDMSPFIFVKSILENRSIKIFNNGLIRRDFTYIDDIVEGIHSVIQRPFICNSEDITHRLYNLGNTKSIPLLHFIEVIEASLEKKAVKKYLPMQLGDVVETCADIEASRRDLEYDPKVSIEEGIPKFIDWFKLYYGLS